MKILKQSFTKSSTVSSTVSSVDIKERLGQLLSFNAPSVLMDKPPPAQLEWTRRADITRILSKHFREHPEILVLIHRHFNAQGRPKP